MQHSDATKRMQRSACGTMAGHTSIFYGSHGDAKLLLTLSPWWKYCHKRSAVATPASQLTRQGKPRHGIEYPKGCRARSLLWMGHGILSGNFFWNHLMIWIHVLLWVKSDSSWTSARVERSRSWYFLYPTNTGTWDLVWIAKSKYNSKRLVGGPWPHERLFHQATNLWKNTSPKEKLPGIQSGIATFWKSGCSQCNTSSKAGLDCMLVSLGFLCSKHRSLAAHKKIMKLKEMLLVNFCSLKVTTYFGVQLTVIS